MAIIREESEGIDIGTFENAESDDSREPNSPCRPAFSLINRNCPPLTATTRMLAETFRY